MILTGKAKQDFEYWYTARTHSAHTLMLVHFYNKKEIEQYAWYIEWFDSVGIYLTIGRYGYIINTKDISITRKTGDIRDEATKQAIIHANRHYNFNNNQD